MFIVVDSDVAVDIKMFSTALEKKINNSNCC